MQTCLSKLKKCLQSQSLSFYVGYDSRFVNVTCVRKFGQSVDLLFRESLSFRQLSVELGQLQLQAVQLGQLTEGQTRLHREVNVDWKLKELAKTLNQILEIVKNLKGESLRTL